MALIGTGGDTCKAEAGGGTGLGGVHTEEKGGRGGVNLRRRRWWVTIRCI